MKITPKEIYSEYQKAREYKSQIGDRGIYDTPRIDGKAVLVPHWEDTVTRLHTFIFEKTEE